MTRKEAIKILSCRDNRGLPITWQDGFVDAVDTAIEALQEQKTGKWIKKSNTNPYWTEWWYECSECCHTPLHDRYRQEALTDFCPNCGARMENES